MLRGVGRVIAADRISMAIFSEASDEVQIVTADESPGDPELDRTSAPRGDTVLAKIMLSPPSCYLSDLRAIDVPWVQALAEAGLGSAVIVPIVSAGTCLGTLNVARPGGQLLRIRNGICCSPWRPTPRPRSVMPPLMRNW